MALAAKSAKLRELEVQVPELQKELATGKQVGARAWLVFVCGVLRSRYRRR